MLIMLVMLVMLVMFIEFLEIPNPGIVPSYRVVSIGGLRRWSTGTHSFPRKMCTSSKETKINCTCRILTGGIAALTSLNIQRVCSPVLDCGVVSSPVADAYATLSYVELPSHGTG